MWIFVLKKTVAPNKFTNTIESVIPIEKEKEKG